MEDNTKPILKRELDYTILHVRTNNTTYLMAQDIFGKLSELKSTILDACKSCKVIVSQPTLCLDNGKAALTNHHLSNLLEELNINIDRNHNIDSKHLRGN